MSFSNFTDSLTIARRLSKIAFRSLGRNRRRSILTSMALAAGTLMLVFVHAFANGLLEVLVLRNVDSRLGAIQITLNDSRQADNTNHKTDNKTDNKTQDKTFIDDPQLREKIAAIKGVRAITPRLHFGASLEIQQGTTKQNALVIVEAIDPVHEFLVCPQRRQDLVSGQHLDHVDHVVHIDRGDRVDDATQAQSMPFLAGQNLATGIRQSIDDRNSNDKSNRSQAILTLQTFRKDDKGVPSAVSGQVSLAGVVNGSMFIESKRGVLLRLEDAQILLQKPNHIDTYAIAVNDLDDVPRIRQEIRDILHDFSDTPYQVAAWDEVIPFLHDVLIRLRVILSGLTIIVFAVVGFGIVNTATMSVHERIREIGTMLAIGAQRRQILWLFIFESAVLGFVGGGVGVFAGSLLVLILNLVGIPLTPPGTALVQSVHPQYALGINVLIWGLAVLSSAVAAWHPAKQAAALSPADALRSL